MHETGVEKILAKRIVELRKAHFLSQTKAALMMHIDKTTLGRYESGYRMPDAENLVKIAVLYGVPIDYLCGLSDTYEKYRIRTTKFGEYVKKNFIREE